MLEENLNDLPLGSDEDSILEDIFSNTENQIPESEPITTLREDAQIFNLEPENAQDLDIDPVEITEKDQKIAIVASIEEENPTWTVEIEANTEALNERKVDLNEIRNAEPSDEEVGEMIQKMEEDVLIPNAVLVPDESLEELEIEPAVTGLYHHKEDIEKLVENHKDLIEEDTSADIFGETDADIADYNEEMIEAFEEADKENENWTPTVPSMPDKPADAEFLGSISMNEETENPFDMSLEDEVTSEEPIEDVMDEVSKVIDLVSENDNSDLLNMINETNKQQMEEIEKQNQASVEDIILKYELPSDFALIKAGIPDGYKFDDLTENQVMLAYSLGKSRFLKDVCEKIYEEVRINGTSILNKYPGLTKKKLEDYLFDIRMNAQSAEIDVIKKFKNEEKLDFGIEQEPSFTSRYGVTMMPEEDPHQQQVDQANDGRKKAQKQREPGCNPKMIFKTEKINNTNPFCDEVVMNSFFDKSVFNTIFNAVNKGNYGEVSHGNCHVTTTRQSLLVPIVDYPQEGVRFVCIDTTAAAASREPYKYNHMELQSRIPFPNEQFATDYSIYILYANDCLTKPQAVGRAIYKILNWRYMKDNRRILLSARQAPIAYTTEKSAMVQFEEQHSTLSGYGRVRHGQITLIGFVTETESGKNDYTKRFLSRESAYRINDLMETHEMYYIASIHYLESKQTQMDDFGRPTEYILYTITQYTESRSCLLLDGLPVIMGALSKEHRLKYGNTKSYSIVFEYDYTALVSPSVSNILRGSLRSINPEFTIDSSSYNQSLNTFVTSYMIIDDRYKKPRTGSNIELFDDAARNDYRLFFNSPDSVKAQFLANKVTDVRTLDFANFFNILGSLGYVPYKEPKPLAWCLTDTGLTNLDRSPIVEMLFKVNINELQQENAFDYTNAAINDFYNHKYSLMSGFNNADTVNIMGMFTSGVDLFKSVKELFTGKQ